MFADTSSRQATIWTVGSFGCSQVLRLTGNLILARLLIPDDFGMMALVAILMQGLVMFSDVGIGPSIIRSQRGQDPRFLNTAWTIQVVRGAVLWLIAALLCVPFARFYGASQLVYLIPVACSTAFISGFNSTRIFTENRRLNLGRLATLEVGSQLGGVIVMIGWALITAEVWALVAGGLVAALLKAALSHILLPGCKNRFSWDETAIAELLRFGKWIFLSTALAFCSTQLDRIIIGKLLPLDILGVYTIGFMWARAPLQLSLTWSSKVFYPIAVKAIGSGSPASLASLLQYRGTLLQIAAPLIAGLIVAMPKLIELLYLPSYHLAGSIGSIFAVGAWLGILTATYGSINMASDKAQYISFAAAAQIVLFLALVIPLYSVWAVSGVAIAMVASRLATYVVAARGAAMENCASIATDCSYSLLMAGFTYCLYLLMLFVDSQFQSNITALFAIGLVSGLIALLLFYLQVIRPGQSNKI